MEKGQAIPFILIDQTIDKNNEADYSFKIHPRAHEVFNSDLVKNKKVAVAAIAGPQRTGKSFLSNRLLKRMKGFAIGPTTMPCTKGLWIWGEPIKISEDTVLIIMDTQGLNSVQRNQTVDMKIFSLSILLSSVFIYNSIGHIDQKALENMSYVLKISQNIKVSSDGDGDGEISKYFPFFYWVLRDFSLDLKGRTESQYLQSSLRPVNNDDKDARNQIRNHIRKLFQHRRCECFPRPVHQQKRLAHIEDLQYEELRQNFRQKMKAFERTFFSNLPPKTINNKPITGNIYLNLAYEYVNAMNSGGIPKIMNSLQRVIASEVRKICENYKTIYKNAMDELMKKDKLPLDEIQIESTYRKYLGMIQQKFDEKFKSWGDIKLVVDAKTKFYDQLGKDLKNRLKENSKMAELCANRSLQQIFETFKKPEFKNINEITTSFVAEKQEEFNQKYKSYDENNKTSAKYFVFANKFPPLIFDYFGMVIARIKGMYSEQIKNQQFQIQDSKRQLESLKRIMEEQESLILQKEKETSTLMFEKDRIAKELKKNQEIRLYHDETAKMSKKDKAKELQKLKDENLQLQNDNEGLLEINEKLRGQIAGLKLKRQIVQRPAPEETDTEAQTMERIPSNLPSDLVETLMGLRSKLTIMNEFYDKKACDETMDEYMDRQIEDIRNQKFEQIDKIKQEYRKKAETMRAKIDKNKQMYEKQIEMMNKHLDDIKKENIELTKKINDNPGSDQRMKIFLRQKKSFEESLRFKQDHLESQKLIVAKRQKEIQELKEQLMQIEDRYAMTCAEKANLESLKQQFWYLLRESLNYVTGKNNKLKHASNKLSGEDQKNLKAIFNSIGASLN